MINLGILILPLAGLWFLRLYESALIRQTESELVAQAALLGGMFKAERRRQEGLPAATTDPIVPAPARRGLDLATDPVLPPPPDPTAGPPAAADDIAIGQALTPVMHDAQAVTLAAMRVVDVHGVIIATTGTDAGQSLAGLPEIQRALEGVTVSAMRWRETPVPASGPDRLGRAGNLRVFVALPVAMDNRIVAAVLMSRTPRDLGQTLYGKRFPLIGFAAILLGVGVLMALMSSRLVTRPLGQIIAQTRRLAAGEVTAIVAPEGFGTREAADLAAALSAMARTLQQRTEDLRSFAAQVSHEFKTPIASARGAVELISDHLDSMTVDERAHFLELASASIDRLEHLVGRLLDLARADMASRTSTAIALAPVVERLVAEYGQRGLIIATALDPVAVQVRKEFVELMLRTLLDNVVQHGGKNAAARIRAEATGDFVQLTVSDDGVGVAPSDRLRVFDPFFTTARARGGTGIGLPILRSVARAVGGEVVLTATETGTTFKISLPSAII